jgi:hypothetical protein
VQTYVNEFPCDFQDAISSALQTALKLKWVSPLKSERYVEYQDRSFLRALGLGCFSQQLTSFWPNGGPVWDALARDEISGGVVLVEAKSHVAEIYGCGSKAVDKVSIWQIEATLRATKQWLDVPHDKEWKTKLYQSANRLAHLYFFREVLHLPAWLVNVYFINDAHSPTSMEGWSSGIQEVKRALGVKTIPYYADIFIDAKK